MVPLLLGVDIGATSIKAGVFGLDGKLITAIARRNAPVPDPHGQPGWLVWNPDMLWNHVCLCIRQCIDAIGDASAIKGVACTGFGADGVPVARDGVALYPFISWHCARTVPERLIISERVSDAEIYGITGYHNYPINTANRLLWFRRHRPDVLEKTFRWLWIQDYVVFKLSGEFSTECTIASTSMLLDLGKRAWSPRMLDAAEVDPGIMPVASEAGTQTGAVTTRAAAETGLTAGTPVVTGGHDCEVAVLGAGVNDADTWIDVTGTWEILIATIDEFRPTPEHRANGLDFECHALPGQWICQSLMIAGAVIEWVRSNFYRDVPEADGYRRMFVEAETPSNGVYMLPGFMRGMGPDASRHTMGTILGLQTMTSRGQIVRAALEGLCFQLQNQIGAITNVVGKKPQRLRVVGGGQKNPLWLQLKADITGLPVEITGNPEVTLLGAAILAGIGVGLYRDHHEAMSRIELRTECVAPNLRLHSDYQDHFTKVYAPLPAALQSIYKEASDLIAIDGPR